MNALATSAPRDAFRLKAHEIWGGNAAASDEISVPGFQAHVYCRPHHGERAGGDLRFVSTCAAGQIVRFTLADIAGHGTEVSDAALRLRSLIRKHINTPNPTQFARQLNREFTRLSERAGPIAPGSPSRSSGAQVPRFATALITTYFCPTDHLIVCNAGHPRPLLFRAAPRRWELLDERSEGALAQARSRETGISNLPLGMLEPTSYPQFATRLAPGDVYIAYTDAVTESIDPAGQPLGEDGLLGLARRLDPDEHAGAGALGGALLKAVDAFRADRPPDDDLTLLVLRHDASNPPSGPIARAKALGRLVGLVR